MQLTCTGSIQILFYELPQRSTPSDASWRSGTPCVMRASPHLEIPANRRGTQIWLLLHLELPPQQHEHALSKPELRLYEMKAAQRQILSTNRTCTSEQAAGRQFKLARAAPRDEVSNHPGFGDALGMEYCGEFLMDCFEFLQVQQLPLERPALQNISWGHGRRRERG